MDNNVKFTKLGLIKKPKMDKAITYPAVDIRKRKIKKENTKKIVNSRKPIEDKKKLIRK